MRKLDAQERKRIRNFIEVKVVNLDNPRTLGKPLCRYGLHTASGISLVTGITKKKALPMFDMEMPRNLKVLADEGLRGIESEGPDRSSIAAYGYAIKACPIPMHGMSEIGGFDGHA